MSERVNERKRAEHNRPQRVPLHQQRSRMTIQYLDELFPDYVHRYVNEMDSFGSRIARLERAGWQRVTEELIVGDEQVKATNFSLGDGARLQVGLDARGQPKYAVLMRQLREYYDEDQAAKQGIVDEREASLYRQYDDKADSTTYGGVKVEQKTGGRPSKKRKTQV